MKTALFLNTQDISNDSIQTFILTISAFKDIKCELSPFDVDSRRKSRPLLITLIDNSITSTDIWSYDQLAAIGNDGYNLISAASLEDFAKELATTFKYC